MNDATSSTPKLLTLALAALLAALPGPLLAAEPAPVPPDQALAARLAALTSPAGLTAADAAARAPKASPTVRRRAAVVAERDAATRSSQLARVPHLAATLSYVRLSEVDAVELAPGVSIPQVLDTYSAKLELSVPLSDYLLRFPALVDASELRARAARVDQRGAALQAESQARAAYWRWVGTKLRVLVSEQSLTQVRATVAQMQARVDAQRASKAELLRLASLEAEARRTLFDAEQSVKLAERRLALAIGASPFEVFTIGEDLTASPQNPHAGEELGPLVERALAQRSEIAALDLALAALGRNRSASSAALYPRLDAVGTVNYDNPNSRVFLGGDRFDATWALGLRVSWTLGDALGASPADDALAAQERELRADRWALAQQLELDVASALRAVAVAEETRRTSAEARVAAEEAYRIRAALLESDRATAVELVDAETELTRTRIAEVNALVDLHLALADLGYTLGDAHE